MASFIPPSSSDTDDDSESDNDVDFVMPAEALVTPKRSKTPKERKLKWKESLTNKQKKELRKKDRDRKRKERKEKVLSEPELKAKRDKDRERQRRYREKKRANRQTKVRMGFGSKQAEGKALHRAMRALPSTPTRSAVVVESLVKHLSPSSRKRIFTPDEHRGRPSISKETCELVQNFYEDDSISRVLPGKKDVRSVRDVSGGPKQKKRKRNLLDDIYQLHEAYNLAHPENQVGRTKFFQLRPSWVIPVQQQSQEVCQCIYHENIDLICESVEKFARKKKILIDFKAMHSADAIWTSTVCDKYNEDCCWRRCKKCGTSKIQEFFEPILPHSEELVEVYQWKTVTVDKKKENENKDKDQTEVEISEREKDEDQDKKEKDQGEEEQSDDGDESASESDENYESEESDKENTGGQKKQGKKKAKKQKNKRRVTRKIPETMTVKDTLKKLEDKLKPFAIHNHTNITQLHKFKTMKDNLQEGEIIISEDFSENYSLKQQNEIMTAHWSCDTLTLFCATVHYTENGQKKFLHYIIVSDDLKHEKNSIWYFNRVILNDVKARGIKVDKIVHYWHDGPSCQFKNQFNFTNTKFHEEDNGTPADLNFFATSHGKGENDGTGGDVKNYVWRKTLQKKAIVTNANEFVELAREKFPDFVIMMCSSTDIRTSTQFLKDRYKSYSKPFPNIRAVHHLAVVNGNLVGNIKSPPCKCHPVAGDLKKSSTEVTLRPKHYTKIKKNAMNKICMDMNAIKKVQEDLDDHQRGQFFAVYYDDRYYWGKCLNMFSEDRETNVKQLEINFLRPQVADFEDEASYWDWPKKEDRPKVPSKFIFYGPCMPAETTKKGFVFSEEEEVKRIYKVLKTNNKLC